MAINVRPSIVTSGLVLNLDAANMKSYPRSGTTWRDLSGLGNNGTLTNGPSYSSGNGGSIVFDGTDDYVTLQNNATFQIYSATLCCWVKTVSPGSSYRGLITKQSNYGLFLQDGVLVTYDWGAGATRTTSRNIANGNWNHVCMSFTDNTGTPLNNAIIYINALPVLTTTIKYNNNNIEPQIGAGGTLDGTPNGSRPIQQLNGNIAQAQVYNRALTPSEILQNYNATKTRFGLQ